MPRSGQQGGFATAAPSRTDRSAAPNVARKARLSPFALHGVEASWPHDGDSASRSTIARAKFDFWESGALDDHRSVRARTAPRRLQTTSI